MALKKNRQPVTTMGLAPKQKYRNRFGVYNGRQKIEILKRFKKLSSLFIIYKRNFRNKGWNEIKKRLFGSSHWKISGRNGTSENIVPVPG